MLPIKQTKKVLSDAMIEEWREIVGFPNYLVSSLGRIYNMKHDRFLKEFYTYGYAHVQLYCEGRAVTKKVHRLVAEAFLYRENLNDVVNHIDGDRGNNVVFNLEWCSQSQNVRHSYYIGNKFATNKKEVCVVETQECFDSLTDCAQAISGQTSSISMCLSGKLKKHRGLTFKIKEAFE